MMMSPDVSLVAGVVIGDGLLCRVRLTGRHEGMPGRGADVGMRSDTGSLRTHDGRTDMGHVAGMGRVRG